MDIRIRRVDEADNTMEFDLVGVSPSFANALRRILISEVPTMAIEHVFFLNNTSTIPDEILAHRLGLIPIAADPALFKSRSPPSQESGNEHQEDDRDQRNTIVLRLQARCSGRNPGGKHEDNEYGKVKSKDLKWLPGGSEIPEETGVRFTVSQDTLEEFERAPVRPVHDDILIAKLSSGQEIELEAHCTKGTGAEHAKWSPVATAWYRLCPEVVLLREVKGEKAEELLAKFEGLPKGVECPFEVVGGVARPREGPPDLMCLERIRALSGEEEWKDYVQLRKIKDHFIFTVESSGVLPPQDLLCTAINILASKAGGLAAKLAEA